ncbi:hypothetical protein [Bradyrhizobium sp. CCBAU 51627]|uniref:hypothetical protein n=1 Tax=Bradyrhizobium sp. CCBAU 51627 TaxID=1325088 RepID=UPI0023061234|nr:hypothetical protein [Bradyrhizobium sp. CCBAU 51627]
MFPIHHILPQLLAEHPVINRLANRFDIDGIKNRMALPATQGLADDLKSSPHSGGHLRSYYNGFLEYLDEVESTDEFAAGVAGRESRFDEIASDLNRLLAAAKYAQANGHLFPNTPTGVTREQANAANERWFKNWRSYAKDNEDQIQEMLDTINQLSGSGQWNGALHWPILSPTSTLSLEDRIKIRNQFPKGSPISRQFTAIGSVPELPGLVPSFVNTGLPGFIPMSPDEVKQPEGFTPGNSSLTFGLRGFPALDPAWQRIGQPPPSTAAPPEDPTLQYDMATGLIYPSSAGSPGLAYPSSSTSGSSLLPWLAGAAALGVAAFTLPAWLVAALGVGAVAGAASGRGLESGSANPTEVGDERVFAKGASSFASLDRESIAGGGPSVGESRTGSPLLVTASEPGRVDNFAERFGNWPGIPAGTMPTQPPSVPDATMHSAAEVAAPEEVRRLTRVNASNAGSVFESGSAPVPYLPSPEFDARFSNWREQGRHPQRVSSPLSAFADEPGYAIPPPVWGLDASSNKPNDAEEWFSRWIQPLLRQD